MRTRIPFGLGRLGEVVDGEVELLTYLVVLGGLEAELPGNTRVQPMIRLVVLLVDVRALFAEP